MDLDELSCIGKGGASSFVTPSRFDKASLALKSKSARHHLRTGCVPSRKAIYEGTLVKRDAEVKSRKPVQKLACDRRRNQGCVLFQKDQCGQVTLLKFGIAHAPRTLQAVGLQAAATSRVGEHVLINRIELAVLTPMMATLQELCRKDLYSTPRATPEMLFACACEAATASVCSKTVVMTLNATHRRQEAPPAYNGSQ
ncbi:hypothetical protein HPB52_003114 [Rhipicephalus sanguineus]|uniref:Uncharacterized protein n=1 Tax=Rhipicephalus sanguineus TaxID=34632 RepID=A0A9D4QGY7_RHISA|nr:hypothetical protein HPB52_003114 [Rhipicephalus sanguineus]